MVVGLVSAHSRVCSTYLQRLVHKSRRVRWCTRLHQADPSSEHVSWSLRGPPKKDRRRPMRTSTHRASPRRRPAVVNATNAAHSCPVQRNCGAQTRQSSLVQSVGNRTVA